MLPCLELKAIIKKGRNIKNIFNQCIVSLTGHMTNKYTINEHEMTARESLGRLHKLRLNLQDDAHQ